MGELDALLQKKEELMAKIQRIAESCEGIENESNAAKVAELKTLEVMGMWHWRPHIAQKQNIRI